MTKRKIANHEDDKKIKNKKMLKQKVVDSENESEPDDEGNASLSEEESMDEDVEDNELGSKHTQKSNRGSREKEQKTKPDWKAFKEEKKNLKVTRKKSNCSFFEVTLKAKKSWETLRRSDCPKEVQENLQKEIHELLKGNYKQVVYTHDMARIVQWIIKTGNETIHAEITEELKKSFLEMVQQKYSSFCISKMLENGSKLMVKAVIDSFIGHTVKLMCHNIASKIVTIAYSKHADTKQKNYMKQDFYGEMFKLSRNDNVQCLEDAFKISSTMKDGIIASTRTNLNKVLNKGQVGSELVHTVLHDLLGHLGTGPKPSAIAAAEREELLALLRPMLPALPTSKHGAWISMQCLWTASPKERKNIMKACKDYIKELAFHEHGHLTLLSMIDCVDDTVLLSKVILATILENAFEYASNEYGRKVIEYLTAHRDTQFFHPQIISMLTEGDNNAHSKKPRETRCSEILGVVSKPLLEQFTNSPLEWVKSYPMCMVSLAILKNCKGPQLETAYKAIADLLILEDSKLSENEVELCAVENLSLQKMLRRLIENDKTKLEQDNEVLLFSGVLAESLGPHTLWWLQFNRGAFLLVYLLESGIPHVVDTVKKLLLKEEKKLKASKTTGAKVLLKKLSELKTK